MKVKQYTHEQLNEMVLTLETLPISSTLIVQKMIDLMNNGVDVTLETPTTEEETNDN